MQSIPSSLIFCSLLVTFGCVAPEIPEPPQNPGFPSFPLDDPKRNEKERAGMQEYERYVSQATVWVERLVDKADASQEVELYIISASPATKPDGHVLDVTDQNHIDGYPILRQRKSNDPALLKRLAEGLKAMVANRPKESADCFMPHHAVRLRLSGKNYFILICFTCSSAHVYPEGNDGLQEIELPIAKELEPIFDQFFAEHGLHKAP